MEILNRANVPSSLLISASAPKPGIVHIGMGNFHRAHLALFTANAVKAAGGNWGIIGYSFRNRDIVDAMKSQDCLYGIITIDPKDESVLFPGIHYQLFAGINESTSVIVAIAEESTKIISITVTEAGYFISQANQGLDFANPQIQADLDLNALPQTMVGLVVRGLIARFKQGALPITILSCDNLNSNGEKTLRVVSDFIGALGNNSPYGFNGYVTNHVTFPNSMVDRIVPSTETSHQELMAMRTGLIDQVPVPAEAFSMWVIEDNFAAGRPHWELSGAIFSEDVADYEVMKLRLLNGAHSLLAYLGILNGCETIPESRYTPIVEDAIRHLLQNEYLPTFTMPRGLSSATYIEQLFARWSNTQLGDKTYRVGSDGSTKLPQRITEPALFHLKRGKLPAILALTVSSYLACIAPRSNYKSNHLVEKISDPMAKKIKEMRESSTSDAVFIEKFFKSGIMQEELNSYLIFIETVSSLYSEIMDVSVESAIQSACTLSKELS